MKKVWENPTLYVEHFMVNQNVAAGACGGVSYDYDPIAAEVGERICDNLNCGHVVQQKADKNGDGLITVFNGNGECEYVYESYGSIKELGKDLTGNASWSSDEHALVINGEKIPS